uniref:Beta-lactamase-related domain-containing protein n=1 Tax=Setaria digitata TaxID=48799 RepID=A0A915PW13_9BILA
MESQRQRIAIPAQATSVVVVPPSEAPVNPTAITSNPVSGFVCQQYLSVVLVLLVVITFRTDIMSQDSGKHRQLTNNIFGTTTEQFANVEKVFRKNFDDGWEREGAAISIYHNGELVVDLQGGYADASSLRPWTSETRTVVFSATKAVGALCIAVLIDRGRLQYSDRISQFWPEFGQNGKENITVGWVMNHRAGLATFDEPISKQDAFDHEKIAEIIERQKPNWTPGFTHLSTPLTYYFLEQDAIFLNRQILPSDLGTKTGYHAITYGWLVDQIIRHADLKHRGIGTFFKEEIAEKFDIDFHFGLPSEEEHTVSRLTTPPLSYKLKEILYDPRILYLLSILNLRPPNSLARKIRETTAWMKMNTNVNTFNDPDLHRMEQAAALGITKAKDLAKLFALFLQGKIVSNDLLDLFRSPEISHGLDEVVLAPLAKGYGFMYERHPYKPGCWLVGHAGLGGSTIMMDMEEKLVVAYVSNGLKVGTGELTRTYRLLRNAALRAAR